MPVPHLIISASNQDRGCRQGPAWGTFFTLYMDPTFPPATTTRQGKLQGDNEIRLIPVSSCHLADRPCPFALDVSAEMHESPRLGTP